MSLAVSHRITAVELLAMPDAERYELVDGELVERQMGRESSWISGEVFRHLANFVSANSSGWAFPDGTSYQCFDVDGERVRRPDASYVSRDRLPEGPVGEGHFRVAPDLAVDVISPNDTARDVFEEVEEYLSAGVRVVWLINPSSRTAMIYRADRTIGSVRHSETLSGEDVLPGFAIPVNQLFPPTPAPQPPQV